ncbi:hypothetical protein ACWGB8_27660 [Kitasatospora sp. NPDC054939]
MGGTTAPATDAGGPVLRPERPKPALDGHVYSTADGPHRPAFGRRGATQTGPGRPISHLAPAVQERALRLAAQHLSGVAPATAEAVRSAAVVLGPALRPEAHRLLAIQAPAEEEAAEPHAVAPPMGQAALPAAPAGPLDLAERLAAVMADQVPDPGEFEVILAALVAEHHHDAAALHAALAPLTAGRDDEPITIWQAHRLEEALGCLLDALPGRSHLAAQHAAAMLDWPAHLCSPGTIPVLRALEVASRIGQAPVPLLLATPTAADGAVDPAVFTERLAAHRAAGALPWPADLAQSLLRLPPDALSAARSAAAELGCEPGVLRASRGEYSGQPGRLRPDAAGCGRSREGVEGGQSGPDAVRRRASGGQREGVRPPVTDIPARARTFGCTPTHLGGVLGHRQGGGESNGPGCNVAGAGRARIVAEPVPGRRADGSGLSAGQVSCWSRAAWSSAKASPSDSSAGGRPTVSSNDGE